MKNHVQNGPEKVMQRGAKTPEAAAAIIGGPFYLVKPG